MSTLAAIESCESLVIVRFPVEIRILTAPSAGATLTMSTGRRYGLIGRNGVGKSTLLRHIALREVPIPTHISVLYVEQEIAGDETTALDSVLQADVWAHKLKTDEAELNVQLEKLEKLPTKHEDGQPNIQLEQEKDELAVRLGEIQKTLVEMEAETGPARAGALLAGLGFNEEDQKKTTKSFSGGWRMRLALARALYVSPDVSYLAWLRPMSCADNPASHVG